MLCEFNKLTPLLGDQIEHPEAVRRMREANDRREKSAFMRKLKEDMASLPENGDLIACIAERDWESFIEEEVLRELHDISQNHLYAPPFHAINEGAFKGMTLYSGPDALVAISAVEPTDFLYSKRGSKGSDRSVAFSGNDGYIRFIKAGGLKITHWQSPLITSETELGAHLTCSKGETIAVKDGDCVRMTGGTETIVFESCEKSFTMLQISLRNSRSPVVPEYEVSSRRLVACSASDQKSSRLQMLSSLVRLLDGPASAELQDRLTRHPDHFVRWHAMREWLSKNADEARPRLEEMAASDLNPQVRQAAAMTFEMLFTRETEEA
ncbi:HEAT repeat domain-containing protein [Alteriqipengyuania sp. 357]